MGLDLNFGASFLIRAGLCHTGAAMQSETWAVTWQQYKHEAGGFILEETWLGR